MPSATRPRRIQRRRTRGWRMPDGCVSVTRPGRWGNPYRVGQMTPYGSAWTAAEAVDRFRDYLLADSALVADARAELAGKDLACWCAPGEPCHADVLLEVANA